MSKRFIAVAMGVAFAVSATSAEAKHRYRHSGKATYSYHHRRHASRFAAHGAEHGTRGATVDRSCLVPAARALLARIEANFGPVEIVSTCRAGAIIAGTNHPSLHRYGMAIDFKTRHKAEVVRWLAANNPGGTMTYSNMDHIHADVGHYHFVSLAGHRHIASRHRHGEPAIVSEAGDNGAAYANADNNWNWPAAEQFRERHYARHARRGRHEGTF